MENALRTEAHLARIAKRRNDLSDILTGLISPRTPFVWEVGCGHGHFLTAYASSHPQELCIGVDITKDRIDRGLRKRDRAKLPNLHFIHAEAAVFLASLPKSAVFSSIFVLFPDPWPKRRHHKNRVLQPEFLTQLAEKSRVGAQLCFRTDYEPYFRETEAILQKDPAWKVVLESWPFEQLTVFQSRAIRHFSLVARRQMPGHKFGSKASPLD